jgi:hypothetical protein
MKRLAKPEKMAWQFDYRIDWDAQVASGPHRAAALDAPAVLRHKSH